MTNNKTCTRSSFKTGYLRCLALLMGVFLAFGAAQPLSAQATIVSRKYGDINGDGEINEYDRDRILEHIAAATIDDIKAKHPDWILTGISLKAADINGDGTVDSRDTLRALEHISASTVSSVYAKHPEWILTKTFTYDDGKKTYTTYYVTADSGLILRNGRGTGYTKIITMPYGSSLSVEDGSMSGGWAAAQYNGKTGYCSTSYISKTKPRKSEQKKVQERLDKILNGKLSYNKNTVMKKGKKFTGYRANEQCKGYAKNVFYLCFKVTPSSTKSKPNNYKLNSVSGMKQIASYSSITKDKAQKLFAKARPGDFVQIRRKHTGSHSAIVYSVTSSGVTFVEANLDGKNTVYKRTYTWKDLASKNAGMTIYTATSYKLK